MERSNSPDKQHDLALIRRTDNCKFSRRILVCSHCKRRRYLGPKCWQKYPHLIPGQKSFVMGALPYSDKADSSSDDEKFVCILAVVKIGCCLCVIDSGATFYLGHQKDRFVGLERFRRFNTKMRESFNVTGNE